MNTRPRPAPRRVEPNLGPGVGRRPVTLDCVPGHLQSTACRASSLACRASGPGGTGRWGNHEREVAAASGPLDPLGGARAGGAARRGRRRRRRAAPARAERAGAETAGRRDRHRAAGHDTEHVPGHRGPWSRDRRPGEGRDRPGLDPAQPRPHEVSRLRAAELPAPHRARHQGLALEPRGHVERCGPPAGLLGEQAAVRRRGRQLRLQPAAAATRSTRPPTTATRA